MPPKAAPAQGQDVPAEEAPSAVSVCPDLRISTLTKRADFLKAARAKRAGQPGFLLQARYRDDETDDVHIGFTCSKKIGNAVARNRAKRRLREIARAVVPQAGQTGWDYVLVGRPDETANRDFQELLNDLRRAFSKIHP
jgi:ribonuclease P protein component